MLVTPRTGACVGGHVAHGRARARRRLERRGIEAALIDALVAFQGNKRDRRVWGAVANRIGLDDFRDAYHQALSEIAAKNAPPHPRELPRIFQNVLNERFPRGGAR